MPIPGIARLPGFNPASTVDYGYGGSGYRGSITPPSFGYGGSEGRGGTRTNALFDLLTRPRTPSPTTSFPDRTPAGTSTANPLNRRLLSTDYGYGGSEGRGGTATNNLLQTLLGGVNRVFDNVGEGIGRGISDAVVGRIPTTPAPNTLPGPIPGAYTPNPDVYASQSPQVQPAVLRADPANAQNTGLFTSLFGSNQPSVTPLLIFGGIALVAFLALRRRS